MTGINIVIGIDTRTGASILVYVSIDTVTVNCTGINVTVGICTSTINRTCAG